MTYAAQKIVPCECGSPEPYWHGPETGVRVYCCNRCWARMKRDEAQVAYVEACAAFEEATAKEVEAKRLCALFDRLEAES